MKNKNLMIILGIALAYHFYKMYTNKQTTGVIKTPVMPPPINYPSPINNDVIKVNEIPSQFLVDKVTNDAQEQFASRTYQTYYATMSGNNNKVPCTC